MNEENELITAAMQIIMYAGNARNEVSEALEKAKQFNFIEADVRMQKADQAITMAHKSQTDIIQKEASGYRYEPTMLFAHAQDTLMTIKSELNLSKQLIDILKIIKDSQ